MNGGPSSLVRGRSAAASRQLRVACTRIATSAGPARAGPSLAEGHRLLPPPSEVTPHPVPLADGVDHDPPYGKWLPETTGRSQMVCLPFSLERADTLRTPD